MRENARCINYTFLCPRVLICKVCYAFFSNSEFKTKSPRKLPQIKGLKGFGGSTNWCSNGRIKFAKWFDIKNYNWTIHRLIVWTFNNRIKVQISQSFSLKILKKKGLRSSLKKLGHLLLLTIGLDWFVRFPLNIYYSDLWPFFKVVFFFSICLVI